MLAPKRRQPVARPSPLTAPPRCPRPRSSLLHATLSNYLILLDFLERRFPNCPNAYHDCQRLRPCGRLDFSYGLLLVLVICQYAKRLHFTGEILTCLSRRIPIFASACAPALRGSRSWRRSASRWSISSRAKST